MFFTVMTTIGIFALVVLGIIWLCTETRTYQARKQLEIDRTLFNKEKRNWEMINEYREERRDAAVAEAKEIGRAEGTKTALTKLESVKDEEIKLLKELLSKTIESLGTSGKSITQNVTK